MNLGFHRIYRMMCHSNPTSPKASVYVVIIVMDRARQDRLSCNGYEIRSLTERDPNGV